MTRDQFLTEKVLGECYHEPVWCAENYESYQIPVNQRNLSCKKCLANSCEHYNFSTWQHFGILWNLCKEQQEWWRKFLMDEYGFVNPFYSYIRIDLINPDTFADAIARYRGWEGE